MPPNGFGIWCVRTRPLRQRSAADRDVTSCPLNITAPASGLNAPTRTLKNVVLPAPFGPTMPTASLWRMVKFTPSRTVSAWKRLQIPVAESTESLDIPVTIGAPVPSSVEGIELGLNRHVGIRRMVDRDEI